jgi:hypothetical protein
MSLAMYAAPFNNNDNLTNSNHNHADGAKKRNSPNNTHNTHTKTQKSYHHHKEPFSDKVNSVLQTIHNLPADNEDDDDNNGYMFNPISPPTSVGVENTKLRENEENKENNTNTLGNSNVDKHEDYYKRFIPNYQAMYKNSPHNVPYHNSTYNPYDTKETTSHSNDDSNSVLIEKLNYMISLLEQNQDEKTQNVMEEVILYSFIGIFIIFLTDSFVRVGKYVR